MISLFTDTETVLLEMLLFTVCTVGDQGHYISDNLLFRAAVDNITHGLVGFISWALVIRLTSFNVAQILQCSVCMVLAMAVDVDHFLAAKSFKLQVKMLTNFYLHFYLIV